MSKQSKRPCFFYINTAFSEQNKDILKVGISFDPDKRVVEFNNGIRHRHRRGYCDLVNFSRAFTIKLSNRKAALSLELWFKRKNKGSLAPCYGTEVFSMRIDEAVRMIQWR